MTRQYYFEIEGKETFSLTTEAVNYVILLNNVERDILKQLGERIINGDDKKYIDNFRIIRTLGGDRIIIFTVCTIHTIGSASREEVRVRTANDADLFLFRNLKSDCYYGYKDLLNQEG